MNATVKDFRCKSCGAPLPIANNSKGSVRCPSCRTEYVLDGFTPNTEIAANGNINSGISLQTTPAALHSTLISLLLNEPHLPLDVFEQLDLKS